MKIKISEYPELKFLAWSRRPDGWIDGSEALSLYETNWGFVNFEKMTEKEKELLDVLVEKFGNGVFLHA